MSVDVLSGSSRSAAVRGGFALWRAALREPLLHFLLLGAVLFAVDHFIAVREDDPLTIVLDASVDKEARDTFRAARLRDPDEKEMAALHQIWLDNEVLYREGLALQVDKGDPTIRERVIFKALSLVNADVKLPETDDQQLRQWFEAHRDRYDQPLRLDFEEAVLPGTPEESRLRSFVADLNAGTRADTGAGLRVFTGRPEASIVQGYDAQFAAELARAPVGEWRAYRVRDRWYAMRLTGHTPATPANYEALRGPVMQDWQEAIATEQRTAAVRALSRKYHIVHVGR